MLNVKLKRYLGILLSAGLSFNCTTRQNNATLFGKRQVCPGLWVEKFRVFSGGAYSAEMYADYITDSLKFRRFIGQHDDMSTFAYECNGDSLLVTEFLTNSNGRKTLRKKTILHVARLRSQGVFE